MDSAGNPDAAAALRVQQGAIDEGLLLLTCGALGNVVRIIPALIVDDDEMRHGIEALSRTLKNVL